MSGDEHPVAHLAIGERDEEPRSPEPRRGFPESLPVLRQESFPDEEIRRVLEIVPVCERRARRRGPAGEIVQRERVAPLADELADKA